MALNTNYNDNKKIVKIVITGGPCAGKTTAMSWITNTFTKQGYTVLFIPETATSLISSGVTPGDVKQDLNIKEFKLNFKKPKKELMNMQLIILKVIKY